MDREYLYCGNRARMKRTATHEVCDWGVPLLVLPIFKMEQCNEYI
ncbi:hypothetical protein SAMN05518670_1382 [Paenibacillus sp. OK076]|nr:hypothetical protein SAMN05518670_1382 [Paenibacillus sp. OK076]